MVFHLAIAMEVAMAVRRVAVVDDDPAVRRVLLHLLKSIGLAVTLYAGADEAIAGILASPPDMLLLDLHLGEVPGEVVLDKVAHLVPAIFLISADLQSLARLRPRVHGTFEKPFVLHAIADRLLSVAHRLGGVAAHSAVP